MKIYLMPNLNSLSIITSQQSCEFKGCFLGGTFPLRAVSFLCMSYFECLWLENKTQSLKISQVLNGTSVKQWEMRVFLPSKKTHQTAAEPQLMLLSHFPKVL